MRPGKTLVSIALATAGGSILAALLVSTSCKKKVSVLGPRPAEVTTLRIDPPAPKKRIPAKVDATALPADARAQFPAYDGDAFFVTLPARPAGSVSSTEVLTNIITPILKAVGFERGANG